MDEERVKIDKESKDGRDERAKMDEERIRWMRSE